VLIDIAVLSSATDKAEHVGSGSELLLESVDLSDSGTYICNTSNSHGSTTAHAIVRVTGQSHTITGAFCSFFV